MWTRFVLNFMEKHPEIPSELYGQWWKVISDEFGPIIEEDENEETEARGPLAPPLTAEDNEMSRTAKTQQSSHTSE